MKRTVALLGFVALAAVAMRAQNRPASTEPVIELPKFVVTDTRELPPPESWRYTTIAGFEILTNASDRATQRLIRDFDMFRQALSYVWPLSNRATQPTSLIICGRGNKFDAFVSAGKATPDTGLASLFLKQRDRTAIVIDLQSTTLNVLNIDGLDDLATGTDSGLISVEHDKQLYREYVRFLLSGSEPRLPAWLEEGLSQIIMRMQFDKRWIEFAKLEDPNTISAQAAIVAELNAAGAGEDGDAMILPGAPAEDRDFPAALRRRRLVDLDRFFAVAHDSREATNVLGNNIWAKQAYAFVHMCLYGERGKFQKPFATFVQRLAREPVTEAMFKECFNMTYKQMLMQIRGYCDFTVYEAKLFQSKKGGPDMITVPPPLALRDATQSEIGRIKGEALGLAGHAKAARAELIAPYIRGERDPELLAALGLHERRHGEEERARKFLEAAFTGNAKRPEALLELARFRFADALAKPAGAEGRLSAAQLSSVLDPLLVARQHPPHMMPLYDLVGDAWARAAVKPTREDVKVLIDGAMIFPTRLKLVFQAAVLCFEAGELQPAHALADHGLKFAPDPLTKKRFEDLKESLPPAPAPAQSPPPAAASVPAAPAPTKAK
jgi:hypothetical protein